MTARLDASNPAMLKIAQARAWLIREKVFLGALAMNLAPEAAPASMAQCTYMATDGKRLLFNPKTITAETETVEKVAFVCAHEAVHCALGHFARRGDRDAEGWGVATDHAVNLVLKDTGLAVPDDALCDPKYAGWSAERIYSDIMNKPPKEPGGFPGPSKADKEATGKGRVIDAPPDPDAPKTPEQTQAEAAELAKEWQDRVAQAEQLAKARGDMPGDLAASLARSRIVPQDWKALLRQFATDPSRHDFRWTPPNRKHIWRGAYMPGLRSEELGTLAVFIDTSGSVFDKAPEFIDEARAMLDSGIVARIVVIACDSRAKLVGEFTKGETIEVARLPGGGGTSFKPPFAMLEELGIKPTCAAYLTDLEGDFPEEPGYPTLWIATQPGSAPFGTVVEMNP